MNEDTQAPQGQEPASNDAGSPNPLPIGEAMSDPIFGQPVTEEAEAQSTEPEPEPEAETVPFFTLPDGTQVPQDELLNGYMRQSDYTRKTQALAEKAKETDLWTQFGAAYREAVDTGDTEAQTLLIQALTKGNQTQRQQIDVESFTDGEAAAYREAAEVRQEVGELKRTIAEMASILKEGLSVTQQREQQAAMHTAATKAVPKLKSELGIDVDPVSVVKAIEATGDMDGAEAWMKVHYKDALRQAFNKGRTIERKEASPALGSTGRTFSTKGMSAAEMIARRMKGETPID